MLSYHTSAVTWLLALAAAVPVSSVTDPANKSHAGIDVARPGTVPAHSKTLDVGESEIFEFHNISQYAIGDPSVDITQLSANRLLASAEGAGHTTIYVWDSNGKHTISVTVLPAMSMNDLKRKIGQEILSSGVGDSVVVDGDQLDLVPDQSNNTNPSANLSPYEYHAEWQRMNPAVAGFQSAWLRSGPEMLNMPSNTDVIYLKNGTMTNTDAQRHDILADMLGPSVASSLPLSRSVLPTGDGGVDQLFESKATSP